MDRTQLLKKASELPEQPGVYTMYDKTKKVIYVGKAVNLKNRVQSYFRNTDHGSKTNALVNNADNFEVIITASELDALLTECSLIKQHNPFYNIKLKDGRGYPFIHLFIENGWPNLKLENSKTSNGRYFGPFVMRQNAHVLIDMIKKAFLLPQCSFKARKPDKLCLNYHIKRCAGYCVGKVSEEKIQTVFNVISAVLDGNVDKIYKEVYSDMEKASEALNFEEAAILRDKVKALELIASKQRPMVAQNRNADYIAFYEHISSEVSTESPHCCIFMLRIRNGYVVGERCDIFDEAFSQELLNDYIIRFYTDDNYPPNKIYIDTMYDWVSLVNLWLKDKVTTPTFSMDKDLLEIARKNAIERMLQFEGKTKKGQRQLSAFCDFTGIEKADHIELYDISSIAGSDVVCGMTVCTEGLFAKNLYRKFKIEKMLGFDDTAYMKEAVMRRLTHFKEGDVKFMPLPDLIVCDGGLGQIHAVMSIVSYFGYTIPIIGFKKDSKHKTKTIVFSDGSEKFLSTNPEVFSFCGRLQEEVHRYAISYHKNLRDKFSQQSALLDIKGVGNAKARALFMKFKSIDKIKNATPEQLMEISGINEKLAEIILNTLNNND